MTIVSVIPLARNSHDCLWKLKGFRYYKRRGMWAQKSRKPFRTQWVSWETWGNKACLFMGRLIRDRIASWRHANEKEKSRKSNFFLSYTEEEIDVVNVNEKNLPTNPSARDRRALQTTVAHKIRNKQSNHRRRVSDDDSISSSTSSLSSKGSTPIKIGSQTPNRYVFTAAHSRKRKDNNNNLHDSHKKYRHSKKQKLSQKHHHKQQQIIDPDEAETIEKRNLHNNMERQRRIGLKNLFEELKCQIPSLKDKERAPKVNILREAASYCTKLRRDDELHAELTKKQNRLMTRLRNLKSSIAAQQRRNY